MPPLTISYVRGSPSFAVSIGSSEYFGSGGVLYSLTALPINGWAVSLSFRGGQGAPVGGGTIPDAVDPVLVISRQSSVSGMRAGTVAPTGGVVRRGVDPRALIHFTVSKYRSTGVITSVT